MNTSIEFIAMLLTLISVLLTSRISKYGWAIGIISCILYGIVFYQTKLYFQIGLQFIFLIQGVIGTIYWMRDRDGDSSTIEHINVKQLSIFVVHILISIFLINTIPLLNLSFNTYDIVTSGYSVFATYLLIRKKTIAWLYWIMVDIYTIRMCAETEMYWTTALYVILAFVALSTLINWSKETDEKISE